MSAQAEPKVPVYVRASGAVRARFCANRGRTSLAQAYEQGGLRLRCPHVPSGCEAVLINTGGGIAGGDHASYAFEAEPGSDVTITTQSAEKIYRSQGDISRIDVDLQVAQQARMEWLPQETILFDQALLSRELKVAVAADARVTILESAVFGRLARGETVQRGLFRDRWRVRRDGRLIFAEDVHLNGAICQTLDRIACEEARGCSRHCCMYRRMLNRAWKRCAKRSRHRKQSGVRAPGTGCCWCVLFPPRQNTCELLS
jgi:urease accessory protein